MIHHIKNHIILFIFFLTGSLNVFAQADESMLKAGFIERFTRFVQWPKQSNMTDSASPFIIGIIGETSFNQTLEFFFEKTKIKNKNVITRNIISLDDISYCHIIFIPKSVKPKELMDILTITNTKPILTVSDTEGYAQKGVLINFFIQENRIRFEINTKKAQESGLQVSHLLLNVAKIIN